MHEAAAPHLYGNVHLANLPSFFCGINAEAPANRSSKRALLKLVRAMTLYNPRVTLPSSARRQPSPTVFTIDPVYPYPDRKTLRLVDDTLDTFAALAQVLATWSDGPLLPQLSDFTSTSLHTDKWEPIEQYIKVGAKDETRYANFQSTSTIIHSLIKHARDDTVRQRHWRFWPVSGPYANAVEALAAISPPNTSATQHIDQYPAVLPPVAKNTVVLMKPLVVEMTFGRHLNWPELKKRLARATARLEGAMEIEVGCRLLPTAREKDWGRTDADKAWEMDQVEEINDMLEDEWNASFRVKTKMVWAKDAVVEVGRCAERRGR